MSKPGGAVSAGVHVGAGNRVMCDRQNERYYASFADQTAGRVSLRTYYTFDVLGRKVYSTSKYMPHQGARERNRRRRQQAFAAIRACLK
jgi:hypothetical protein